MFEQVEKKFGMMIGGLRERVALAFNRLGLHREGDESEALSTVEGRLEQMWTTLKKVAARNGNEHPGGWEHDEYHLHQANTGGNGVLFDGFMQWGVEKARVEFQSQLGFWRSGKNGGSLKNGKLARVSAQVRARDGEPGYVAMYGVSERRLELHNSAVPKSIRKQGIGEVVMEGKNITAWLGQGITDPGNESEYGDPQIFAGFRQDGEKINEVMIHVDSWNPNEDDSDGKAESRWIKVKLEEDGQWHTTGTMDAAGEEVWPDMQDSWGRQASVTCTPGQKGSVGLEFKMGNTSLSFNLPRIDRNKILDVGERFATAVKDGYSPRLMTIG